MPTGTPSKEYPYVLVPEDHPAFRNKKAAIRNAKKNWAAQEPAERIGYFIAKVESFIEPDYGIEVAETPISEIVEPSEIESKTPRRPA
jgi:hypothetical protein